MYKGVVGAVTLNRLVRVDLAEQVMFEHNVKTLSKLMMWIFRGRKCWPEETINLKALSQDCVYWVGGTGKKSVRLGTGVWGR